MSCFLQGIRFGVSNSRSHLARVLYLLSFDTSNEPVGRAFDKYLDQIPHWVWLSWIPQLLLSLQRTEAPHCKLVLLKIAAVYPQVDQSFIAIFGFFFSFAPLYLNLILQWHFRLFIIGFVPTYWSGVM